MQYSLGVIPYRIGLDHQPSAASSAAAQRIDALATTTATESPYLLPVENVDKRDKAVGVAACVTRTQHRSKGFKAVIPNLAANVYSPHFPPESVLATLLLRITFDAHPIRGQLHLRIHVRGIAEDKQLLRIGPDDVAFVITSAGNNVLACALHRLRSIHAVDLNTSQNHLLKLMLATFAATLPHAGRHADFHALLLSRLAPHSLRVRTSSGLTMRGRFDREAGCTRLAGSRVIWRRRS